MDFDDLLRRYFDTDDLAGASPDVIAAGIERCQVDLGLERDERRRFALWALLEILGHAPELDATFEAPADREAARNFLDLLASAGDASRQGSRDEP